MPPPLMWLVVYNVVNLNIGKSKAIWVYVYNKTKIEFFFYLQKIKIWKIKFMLGFN